MIFSDRLRNYIQVFFQDQTQELNFYKGLLRIVQKDPDEKTDTITELNTIIKEVDSRKPSYGIFN